MKIQSAIFGTNILSADTNKITCENTIVSAFYNLVSYRSKDVCNTCQVLLLLFIYYN